MMGREWVTSWLAARLTQAREQPEVPASVMAQSMTEELVSRWLRGEADWWRQAAGNPRLTVQQRTMRTRVAMFYEERLAAHEATIPAPSEEVESGD